jgi:hypothetical protein
MKYFNAIIGFVCMASFLVTGLVMKDIATTIVFCTLAIVNLALAIIIDHKEQRND